jgi:hypothetical protein
MRRTISFVSLEAALFIAASFVHFGILASGYEHTKAGTAEAVIGVVLLLGLLLSLLRPARHRVIGMGVQGFALFGTLVGVFTIAIGVGPRTVPDILYHIGIMPLLAWGFIVVSRAPPGGNEGTSSR